MNNTNSNLMDYLFSNAHRMAKNNQQKQIKEVKDDLTEDEAMKIFNDILNILADNNLSYKNATRITVAMANAFLTGGAELYKNE